MLKEVVNKIKEIVDASPIYKEFGEGQIFEIDGKTNQYPVVWLDSEVTPHNITSSSVQLNFDIWFIDLVYSDESNELQIKSDTLDSAIDFVRVLKDSYESLSFYATDNNTFTAQTFTEKWNDSVAGTKLSIQINLPGAGSICKNIFSV